MPVRLEEGFLNGVLGGGAVGKTCAADCKLAGSEVRLWDAMPFAATSLKDVDKTGILLDGIQRTEEIINKDWYYAINVVAQFITADDMGQNNNTGFYDLDEEVKKEFQILLELQSAVKSSYKF